MRAAHPPMFGLVLLAVVLSGCVTAIKYPFNSMQYRATPASYHAVIAIEDARPENERAGVFSDSAGSLVYTKDKDFKPDVRGQLATILADHLRAARILESVTVEDTVPTDLALDDIALQPYAAQGVDLLVIAKLTHFYGYQTEPNSMAGAFGLAGALAEMIGNPKTVGGKVTYSPVRVIDLRQKRVVWEDTVEASFERKVTMYNGQASYALLALKDANHQLVEKLSDQL